MVDYLIDSVFQFSNFVLNFNVDFFCEIIVGDCSGDFGDFLYLCGQVYGYVVDIFCQIFLGFFDIVNSCLVIKMIFSVDFLGNFGNFLCKLLQLVDYGIDGGFQFKDFFMIICLDFLCEVIFGDSCCDCDDVVYLCCEVVGYGVDVYCEVILYVLDFFNICLII